VGEEVGLGRNSIVGTSARRADVPRDLLADEHHQRRDGKEKRPPAAAAVGGGLAPLGLPHIRLVDAEIVSARVACHPPAALRTALPVGRPVLHGVGPPLQGLVEAFFGEHLTHGLGGVFDGDELGAPGRPAGAVQTVGQALGHAFEVGPNRVGGRGGNLVASHPWLLSEMRGVGYLGW
jgi:hypothetical protein